MGGSLRVELEPFVLRTTHDFHIARQAALAVRHALWVRVHDEEGREGWGAAVTTPYYGETDEVWKQELPVLARTLEQVSQGDPFALERIESAMVESVPGVPGARAAFSLALHDLVGKRLGLPVWRMWGLDPVAPTSSFTIGLDDPDTMRRKVRKADCYPILKVKIGTPRDAEILGLIREEAPHSRLRVDANTGWTIEQALAALPMLEEYGVELIEQPLAVDDLDGFRRLRGRSSIPIIADESCSTLRDIPRLAGAVDGVNLKLAKCGSMREAVRMIHCARAHGMQVMLGCMIESTLGIAGAVQLAPLVDHLDLDGAALLAQDPFVGPGIGTNGEVRFNDDAGLGVRRAD